MSSSKYFIEKFSHPVITDMEWSFGLGINNQRSYHENFGAFFKSNNTRGVLNKITPTSIEIGVLNNDVAKGESNCVSLAQVEKVAIFARSEHLFTPDNLNVYVFQLDTNIFHVLAISGQTIKIDRTLNYGKDSFEVDLSALSGKLDDILFGNPQPILIRICISDDEPRNTASSFIKKIAGAIDTDTVELNIKFESFHLVSLLSDVSKSQIIFLKNIEKLSGLNSTNFKYIFLILLIVCSAGGYWYSEKEAEKQEQLRIAELQRQIDEQNAAEYSNQPIVKKDLRIEFELQRTERINDEIRWYEVFKRVSGDKLFKEASKRIRNTIVEVNGWKTRDIKINNTLTLVSENVDIEYLQTLDRADSQYGARALLDFYPDAKINLDGMTALNQETELINKSEMIGWNSIKKQSNNSSLIINLINDLQRLEHEKKIQSWSLRKTKMVTPVKLSKNFIDDYYKYQVNPTKDLKDSDWLIEPSFHKLIVNGSDTKIIKSISDIVNKYSSSFLNKITYSIDTQTTVLEVIIHEQSKK
uniref:Uncharacterized protein n=1 Tax=Aliivibrio wodanis TaxID=80852 RepID=A0A5Q4ZYR3_9GAMM|nr:hypothetical protein [Aliivibrio wodanis]VVV07011.1 hypothetical protein AW0309160_04505 [Aliivibrio wodanis]